MKTGARVNRGLRLRCATPRCSATPARWAAQMSMPSNGSCGAALAQWILRPFGRGCGVKDMTDGLCHSGIGRQIGPVVIGNEKIHPCGVRWGKRRSKDILLHIRQGEIRAIIGTERRGHKVIQAERDQRALCARKKGEVLVYKGAPTVRRLKTVSRWRSKAVATPPVSRTSPCSRGCGAGQRS